MQIAINVEMAFANPTGMGRHAREILGQIMGLDAAHSYTLFHSRQYAWPPQGCGWILPENFRIRPLPISRRQMLASCYLYGGPHSLDKYIGTHSVYHEFGDMLLPLRCKHKIASLHDVSILTVPGSYAWHSRLLFQKVRRRLREADAVITVSRFSKQRIVELLELEPEKVMVIPNGVSPAFCRPDQEDRIRATCNKHGIDRQYILFAGVISRRKNLSSLLRAYQLYRKRQLSNDALLVCCGNDGVGSKDFYRHRAALGLAQDVRRIPFSSDADLADLMAGAKAFVFPSLDEGFGLPVIEAMACGAPVICSNRAALPEVAGNAAVYVEPTDIEQLASEIERVVCDDELARSLRERGFERARQFSWSHAARQVLALYERLL
jgi:glycosyltransferase involved in cell wall biosynthesis